MDFLKRFAPSETLRQRVLHAGFWAFALRIAGAVMRLGRNIVLARILAPDDFGLFGLAMLGLNALDIFMKTGFQEALIQKEGEIESYLDTAWTVQLVRAVVLGALLYLGAPWVAAFYAAPAVIPIMVVLGASVVLQGFASPRLVLFEKRLELQKRFTFGISATVTDFVVSLTAAFILRSVWALVLGQLAATATRVIVSHWMVPHRLRLAFDRDRARELYKFGRWMFLSSVLIFVITQGDDALVGKVLGMTGLGLYQMAYAVSNLPATQITHVISRVAFPTYAKLQGDLVRLRAGHLRAIGGIALASFPLSVGIGFFAPEIVPVLLGAKWLPTVVPIQVLAAYGAVRSIASANGALLAGTGNPDVGAKAAIVKLVFMVPIIYPFTLWWGITGTALATFLPVLISQSYAIHRVLDVLGCRLQEYARPLLIPFLGSMLMSAVAYGLKWIVLGTILRLAIVLPVSAGVYILYVRSRRRPAETGAGST